MIQATMLRFLPLLMIPFLVFCGDANFAGSNDNSSDPDSSDATEAPGSADASDGEEEIDEVEAEDGGREDTGADVPVSEQDPPQGECQPSRQLAGATFQYDSAGTLTITGDGAENSFEITPTETIGSININDGGGNVKFDCIKKLVVNGGGGSDSITVEGIPGLTSVEINGQAGNDFLTAAGGGKADGTPLIFNGGIGDDTMTVSPGGGWGGISANGD